MMTSIVLIACFIGLLFCALMLYRNELVYRFRVRRINEVSEFNMRMINQGSKNRFAYLWESEPSYESQMLDLRKWTYAQFFPDAVGEK